MGVIGENMLPDGWEVKRIDQAGEVQGGRQRSPHMTKGLPRPYLRVANVFEGFIDTSDVFRMPFTDDEYRIYKLEVGDILLNEGQSLELVGRSAVYLGQPDNCCFQNTLIRFRPHAQTDNWFAQFLFEHLRDEGRFAQEALQTTSIAHLGVNRFAGIRVAFPPLLEQRRIAAILSAWAKAEERCMALLDAKRRLRATIVAPLLERDGQPTRLGDVVEESKLRNTGLALGQDTVRAVNKVEGMIPMKENVIGSSLDRYKVVRKDWFAYNPMRLNIGSIARWQEDRDVLVSPDYVVLRCRDGLLDPDYLDHLRHSPRWKRFVEEAGNGSVRVRIYYADLARLRVPLPSLVEQRRIAAVLNTLDREVTLLRQYLDALRKQKRGLMQLLLTGKIRVSADLRGLTPPGSPGDST